MKLLHRLIQVARELGNRLRAHCFPVTRSSQTALQTFSIPIIIQVLERRNGLKLMAIAPTFMALLNFIVG